MNSLITAIFKHVHAPPDITWDTLAVSGVFVVVWELVGFIMQMPDDPEEEDL